MTQESLPCFRSHRYPLTDILITLSGFSGFKEGHEIRNEQLWGGLERYRMKEGEMGLIIYIKKKNIKNGAGGMVQ